MKKDEKRKVRSYKARDEAYKNAVREATKRKQKLATEVERFIEQYSELYDYISR